ncbi:MAG: hypothetical protein M3511_11370, partial [Deinococcota bacterium]|nr:hypothetical protein [Deinococcota bacterium]
FLDLKGAARRVLGEEGAHGDPAILHVGSAYPPVATAVRRAQAREPSGLVPAQILDALTTVRHQTSIQRATGTAEKGSLRSSRAVIRGLVFYAPLTWLDEPTAQDLEVLKLCLKATRHLGLRRNRGRGFVHMSPQLSPQPLEQTSPARNAQDATQPAVTGRGCVRYLPFSLTLTAPVLATSTGGDPNSVQTSPFLPGSMIRGAVAARLAQHHVATDLFNQLVLGGSVHYLNAYPVLGGNKRALPLRSSWVVPKHDAHGQAYDLSRYQAAAWPQEQLKPLSHDVTTADASLAKTVSRTLKLHHRRDRTRGRSTQDEGAIFAYESIDAGQEFKSALRLEAATYEEVESLEAYLKALLTAPLTLGRSRRAEYGGLVRLRFERLQPREPDTAGPLADLRAQEECQLVLVSDYLGRSPVTGQLDPVALEDELMDRLAGQLAITKRFYSFRLVSGYNRTWGAELPQARALKAGSVLVLQALQDIPADRLEALGHSGLGERRAEGFGRVMFVRTGPERFERPEEDSARAEMLAAVDDDPTVLRAMQLRLLRRGLEQRLEVKVAALLKDSSVRASSALLGRLREALRGGLPGLHQELKGLRPKARGKLEACRIPEPGHLEGPTNLYALLLKLCGSEGGNPTDTILDLEQLAGEWRLVDNAHSLLQDELGDHVRLELVSHLIAAFMRQAKLERESQ